MSHLIYIGAIFAIGYTAGRYGFSAFENAAEYVIDLAKKIKTKL